MLVRPGFEPPTSRTVGRYSTNSANRSAVVWGDCMEIRAEDTANVQWIDLRMPCLRENTRKQQAERRNALSTSSRFSYPQIFCVLWRRSPEEPKRRVCMQHWKALIWQRMIWKQNVQTNHTLRQNESIKSKKNANAWCWQKNHRQPLCPG